MAVDLYDAINLFEYSPTGQGSPRNGRSSRRELARDVARELWRARGTGRIVYYDLPGLMPGQTDVEARVIRVNKLYRDRLAETSLILCHEAVHLARARWREIEEELSARYLQISYFDDLLGGLTIRLHNGNRTTQPITLSDPTLIGELRAESEAVRDNRLIDLILPLESFQAYGPSANAEWIRRRIDDWGGIERRLPVIKGFYIDRLAADGYNSGNNADLILKIMKSVNSTDEWNAMMGRWGPVENIRHLFNAAPRSEQFRQDVRAIQARFGNVGL